MGAIVSLLSVIAKTIVYVIKRIPFAIQSAGSGLKVTKGVTNPGKALGDIQIQREISTITAFYGFVTSVFYLLLGIIVMLLLPLIFKVIIKATSGVLTLTKEWSEGVVTKSRDKWYYKIIVFFFKVVPFVIWKFLDYILLNIFRNIKELIALLAVIFLFIFLCERHLNATVELFSDATDVGVAGLNVAGNILQILHDLHNAMLPLTNTVIHYNVVILIHVFDGITHTLENFPGRRLNELGSDAFMALLTDMIHIFQTLYNLQLTVVTTMVDVFFQTGLIRLIESLSGVINLGVTKLVCAIAGQGCFFREWFDFLVFDLLLGFIQVVFCFNLCNIPRSHNIACGAAELLAIGVGSECKGGIISVEPEGLYRNAQSKENRRQLLRCDILEGLQNTSSLSEGCPMVAYAFTPLGNAINMMQLDTHDCYKICVEGVLLESCPDENVYLLGDAFCRRGIVDFKSAKIKVRELMGDKSIKRKKKRRSLEESGHSRTEMINTLKANFGPLVFGTSGGLCDLTHKSESIFDTIVDGACFASKNIQLSDFNMGGRRRLEDKKNLDILSSLRHSRRVFMATGPLDTLPPAVQDDSLLVLKQLLWNPRVPPPPKLPPRRRLSQIVCPPGELLCPNDHQCVVTYPECDNTELLTPLGTLLYYFNSASVFLAGTLPGNLLYNEWLCWKDIIKNKEKSPVLGQNIFASQEDLDVRARYCLPMLRPFEITIPTLKYSLRDRIYESCVAQSTNFTSCNCPMYYPLPSVTLPFFDFLSYDFAFILFNGVIWLKNIFVFVVGGSFGYIWASFFAQPTFSREFSHAFLLYSTELSRDTYWICQFLHLGSVAALVVVVLSIFQVSRFVYDVTWFVIKSIEDLINPEVTPDPDPEHLE